MNLYKKGGYIIDVEKSKVHSDSGSGCITLNFERWFCYTRGARTQKKPIRYCSKNGIVYWTNGEWRKWYGEEQEAINSLFNSIVDNQLLE